MRGFISQKSFAHYIVFIEDSIITALEKIQANPVKIVFAVSESGILLGCLTDGDFRRWISSVADINLQLPVSLVMNTECTSCLSTDPDFLIVSQLSNFIALPLLDSHRRIVSIAFTSSGEFKIGNHIVGEGELCFVIAEIGNNHNGDIDTAMRLIDAAHVAGADCAKFQMRDMSRLYSNAGNSNDMASDLGTQYTLDLLERFQLSDDELFRCFDYAAGKGLVPLCTPWDTTSLEKLNRWGMEGFKVASADFTNHALISQMAATGKPLICSTGMASELEIRSGIRHLQQEGANYVLLHCNSTYPTPFKDVNLRYLERLRELADAPVGYSGHERGIEVPIAAVAMGAAVIEKHITMDRGMEGNDHKVSLLPDEFAQMMQGIRRVEESMGQGGERSISQGEMMNREVLAKSLVAACDVPAGTEITEAMVRIQSPGQGLQPNRIKDLIGRCLPVSKAQGEVFFPSDLASPAATPRHYQFNQSFGLPVRYHDINVFDEASNLDLVEIHLSYKDLDVNLDEVLPEKQSIGLVVHAPELFYGDHTLDLCSEDDSYRQHSITELQRVIDISMELRSRFACPDPVLLVTNVGGFSEHRHLDCEELQPLHARLINSIKQLNTAGQVEIIPQTMPPYPWHFGGQRFHNLFVDAKFIHNFCEELGMRVCLDVSHSKLACNYLHKPFRTFLDEILPFTAHLHLADAKDVDGEGLQINEGEIDWSQLFEQINQHCPSASFIPEIWQGHKNGGEGAWLALERLELFSLNQ